MKDHCRDKSKDKVSVLAPIQDCKPSNKAWKDRKKKQHKDKRDSTNPAIAVNVAEVNNKKRKKKDVSEIMYYNGNKKTSMQPSAWNRKSQKNSIVLGNFYVNDWC